MGRMVVTPPPPSPARDVQAVADRAAKAIDSFSQWFGPYPYSSLALTQMPGALSQGWPGLVFLSSYAFLSPQEQIDRRLDPVTRALDSQVLVHETAHQWWGDLVLWKSYHDQWLSEGLANYASLLVLEQQDPTAFRQVLEKYRSDLASKNRDGEWLRDAGPVTLGQRLISSHFPGGYEAISYERGTWLFHGDADPTISYKNQAEAIKEWTNVLGLGTNPTSTETGLTLGTHQATRQRWQNSCGYVVLEAITSINGDHGPSDALFKSSYVVPFLGLNSTSATDPEIAQCGAGGSSGTGGATSTGGASSTGGAKSTGGVLS